MNQSTNYPQQPIGTPTFLNAEELALVQKHRIEKLERRGYNNAIAAVVAKLNALHHEASANSPNPNMSVYASLADVFSKLYKE